jgi:hypothetical protein
MKNMKTNALILSALMLISFSSCGQSGNDVPANVKSAFNQKFASASKVKWGKENDKEWEAEFKMDGREYSANFDLEGAWIETEYKIESNEIPAAVKSAIEQESVGLKIDETLVSETKDGKVFEVIAGKGKDAMEFVVDANGVIQSKSPVKEEAKKEEKGEK